MGALLWFRLTVLERRRLSPPWQYRRRHDGPLHDPQPAGAPAVQVHRDGPRGYDEVGVAREPAPGLLLLLHGPLRPAQLLRHRREREQGPCALQPHGEDAAALRASRRQARRVLKVPRQPPSPPMRKKRGESEGGRPASQSIPARRAIGRPTDRHSPQFPAFWDRPAGRWPMNTHTQLCPGVDCQGLPLLRLE